MGSVIVTPLYPVYQRDLGFSDLTLTLVYATYTIGNVVALLSFGQISDQIGRRAAALPGLALAALSAVAFLVADGTPWLYLGRLLIGIGVGILSGTGTAWLAEQLGPGRAAQASLAAAIANLSGIVLGPLAGGLLAQYSPAPRVLPFVVYLALVGVVALGVVRTPDQRGRQVERLRDVRVHARLGVPRDLLGRFASPAVAAFAAFALGGLYFSLLPGIVIRDLHVGNLAVGGAIVAELAAVAVIALVLGRSVGSRRAMLVGLLTLVPAVIMIVVAQAAQSMALLLVATVFGGLTLAFGYRGSLETVNRLAPSQSRAEMASTYVACRSLGNSVPVIGIALLTRFTTPIVAIAGFAGALIIIAATAIGLQVRDPAPLDS